MNLMYCFRCLPLVITISLFWVQNVQVISVGLHNNCIYIGPRYYIFKKEIVNINNTVLLLVLKFIKNHVQKAFN